MEYVELTERTGDHERSMSTTQALLGAVVVALAVGLMIAVWLAGIDIYVGVALHVLAILCLGFTVPKMVVNYFEIER